MAATNQVLETGYRDLTADGLAALLADSAVVNPTTIYLEGNPIGDREAELLAGWHSSRHRQYGPLGEGTTDSQGTPTSVCIFVVQCRVAFKHKNKE